jgi:hypothetical protein
MASRCVLLIASLFLLLPASALAERSQRFGDYEVHYSAIPTVTLQPDIARQYGLARSRQLGLLTVTLLHDGEPVPATITALSRDLANQLSEIGLRGVEEGDAVYYIGAFRADDEAGLAFAIRATPRGADAGPFEVVFEQTFFAEG